ncbi:hypothetical protein SAMN05660860_01371 [Geoalkalibacter ferrihydriticus]|uniref:Uncharacterized protein n=2 Tax=Geoalkalibacter ferrihydriticus TaxID=392333 RepID=A0A0C2HSR9_9BACT|nr:hypothetical protein [Geoalkalibacter ferrihydriticus]KIH77850.1 hypothetical protein GFER_04265 [Geoalkalibacter ferrihydriticus DSM 17813]SDL82475.1 hypothetical protein SAMN05660860_01371 [Geoalkalibacter ferrihydriticus]
MLALSLNDPAPLEVSLSPDCPFLCDVTCTCKASFSTLPLDARKCRDLCRSEDFDDCALFLSRLLRRNRPSCGLDPWTMHDK